MGNGKVSSRTRDPSQEKFKRISRKINLDFPLAWRYYWRIRGDRPKDSVCRVSFPGPGRRHPIIYEMNLRKNPIFGEVYYVRSNPRSDSENS
jgi:hypothetical protein